MNSEQSTNQAGRPNVPARHAIELSPLARVRHAREIAAGTASSDSTSRRYDVIIIGSGAGGGTLAYHLAASGKHILILERGDFLPREKENWDPTSVFVNNRYVSADTWYDRQGAAFQPGVHYFVGGATKMYGAALFRLRREDFQGAQPSRRHFAGLANRLRGFGAVLHAGRAVVCRAWLARSRPHRAAGQRTLPVPAGHQ